MAKILVIDDEDNIRQSLKSALERRQHEVVTAASLNEGRRFIAGGFDLILLDIMLPDGNGVDLLQEILAANASQAVVMISGHADIDIAVSAIRSGAHDFLEKPLSLDKILVTIDNVCRTSRLVSEKDRLASIVYGELVGNSTIMQDLKSDIDRAADRAQRFLVIGENGTGKELVAHRIHRRSKLAEGPFVAVNCAALPAELVESELFGHTAGAFTGARKRRTGRFAEADGGSIFLDEISEMPLEAQAKILRVIEAREFTPVGGDIVSTFSGNIIAATNRDLNARVKEKLFRQDLLYRLNVVELAVPPLRERPDDIPVLADHFLRRFAAESGMAAKSLDTKASRHLQTYAFPGNVRELKNLMERLNIYCDHATIGLDDLRSVLPFAPDDTGETLREATRRFESDYIRAALARHDGNVTRAAQELGLERSYLYKKLKQLDAQNGD